MYRGIGEHLAFQFNIVGEGEGIFYVEVKDGQLYVEPYEYYDRDAIFTCKAERLRKLRTESWITLDRVFTLQKLKVEGNIEKALKLKDILAKRSAK